MEEWYDVKWLEAKIAMSDDCCPWKAYMQTYMRVCNRSMISALSHLAAGAAGALYVFFDDGFHVVLFFAAGFYFFQAHHPHVAPLRELVVRVQNVRNAACK
jgi:hypothetical protein